MRLLNSRKGMITDWGDVMKGLIVGLILGALVILLAHMGILPIPLP